MAQVSGITEIRGCIRIELDGVKWIGVCKKHFSLHPLEIGETVDPDAYLDRLAAAQAADCYEAALTMLDSAAQTQNGIVKKLTAKGFVLPAAESAAQRLKEAGLIDDRRFAEQLAQAQISKPVGAYAVRRKLRAKNLSDADIEAVMDSFDDDQQSAACREAASKLYRKYASLPPRECRAKLSQALARRGFGWEFISACIDSVCESSDEFD